MIFSLGRPRRRRSSRAARAASEAPRRTFVPHAPPRETTTMMIDLYVIRDFLDSATLGRFVAETRAAGGGPAAVYGLAASGAVDPLVRRVTRVCVSAGARDLAERLLLERRAEIGRHFGAQLGECEEPQFLRYREGDFFVAHQDGNTPLVHDDTRFRKVSVVVFLNPQRAEPAPGAYGGGSLVLRAPYPHHSHSLAAAADPGTLVAFRSETTHEVTPVAHGERLTVVSWFR
jgi:SM-20-related protein